MTIKKTQSTQAFQPIEADRSPTQQSVKKGIRSTEKSKPYRILERVQNALSSFRNALLSNPMGQESHFFITGQLHASAQSENTSHLKETSKLSLPLTRSSNISSSFNPKTPNQKKTPVSDTSYSALSSGNLAEQFPTTVCSQNTSDTLAQNIRIENDTNPLRTPVREEAEQIHAFTPSAINPEPFCAAGNTTPLKTLEKPIYESEKSPVQNTAEKKPKDENKQKRRTLKYVSSPSGIPRPIPSLGLVQDTTKKKPKGGEKEVRHVSTKESPMQRARSLLNFPSVKTWTAGSANTSQPSVQGGQPAAGCQTGENQTKFRKATASATIERIPEIAEIDPETQRMGEIVKEAKHAPSPERLLELLREFQELNKSDPFD